MHTIYLIKAFHRLPFTFEWAVCIGIDFPIRQKWIDDKNGVGNKNVCAIRKDDGHVRMAFDTWIRKKKSNNILKAIAIASRRHILKANANACGDRNEMVFNWQAKVIVVITIISSSTVKRGRICTFMNKCKAFTWCTSAYCNIIARLTHCHTSIRTLYVYVSKNGMIMSIFDTPMCVCLCVYCGAA